MHDPFPTTFIDEVLDNVGGQEAYSFTDGFSGYHQIRISPEDQHKTTFATELGSYQYIVMHFGIKNAPAIFSRIVVATFKKYIQKFLEVYFDEWTMFGLLKKSVVRLRLMLDTCRKYQISLNIKKRIFCVPFCIFLGHIFFKKGLMVDPEKIPIIVNLSPPKTVLQHTGTYNILQKIYQRICADYCA